MAIERRAFLGSAAALGLYACGPRALRVPHQPSTTTSPAGSVVGSGAGPEAARYLRAASSAAAFIRSQAVASEHGFIWPTSPDSPDPKRLDIYHGSAGVVLFLLEMYRATGEASYLEGAERGARHILATAPEQPSWWQLGLYVGAAGQAFVLLALHDATGDERYLDGAKKELSRIERAAEPGAAGGLGFPAGTDIVYGAAGIILLLLDVAKRLSDSRARDLAVRIGVGLLERSEPGMRTGLRWRMRPDDKYFMPNFSHGTAGVAYSLTRLYQATGERPFIDAALAGAEHLLTIARTEGDTCLIPHYVPGAENRYYLAWCHGPAGTARFFHLLARATGDERWATWRQRSINGVWQSGIPELRGPGFWDNVGQCCGSAAVAELYLDLHELSGEPAYLDRARHIAADILARGSAREDGAIEWIHAENRTEPYWKQSYTGYMQGAAGIGSLLLRMASVGSGQPAKIRLPDNPFRAQ